MWICGIKFDLRKPCHYYRLVSRASNVVRWWSPAIESQGVDRAHRIGETCTHAGQKKKVIVYRVLISGTIEDRILEILARKQRIIDGALRTDGAVVYNNKLGEEDLKSMFGY